jgi:hypothetical protein
MPALPRAPPFRSGTAGKPARLSQCRAVAVCVILFVGDLHIEAPVPPKVHSSHSDCSGEKTAFQNWSMRTLSRSKESLAANDPRVSLLSCCLSDSDGFIFLLSAMPDTTGIQRISAIREACSAFLIFPSATS